MQPLAVELRFGEVPIDASWGIPLDEHAATIRNVTFDCDGLTLDLVAPLSAFWLQRLQVEDDALLLQHREHPFRTLFSTSSLLRELERLPETEQPLVLPEDLQRSAPEDRVAVPARALPHPTTRANVLAAFGAADDRQARDGDDPPADGADAEDLLALLRAASDAGPGFLAELADVIAQLLGRALSALHPAARACATVVFTPRGLSLEAPAVYETGHQLTFVGFRHGSDLHRRRLTSAIRIVRAAHSVLEIAAPEQGLDIARLGEEWRTVLEGHFGGTLTTLGSRTLLRTPRGVDVLCSFRKYRSAGNERIVLELRVLLARTSGADAHASKIIVRRAVQVQPFTLRIEDEVAVLALEHPDTDPAGLDRARSLLDDALRLAPHVRDTLLEADRSLRPVEPGQADEWLRLPVGGVVDIDRQREEWLYDHKWLVALKTCRDGQLDAALDGIRAVDVPWVHDRLVTDFARWCVRHERMQHARSLWHLPLTRGGIDSLLLELLESPAAASAPGRADLIDSWLKALAARTAGPASTDAVLPALQRTCGDAALVECYPQTGPVPVRCAWLAFLLTSRPDLLQRYGTSEWEIELGRLFEDASPLVLAEDLEPALSLHAALLRTGRLGLAEAWADTLAPIVDQSGAATLYRGRLGLPPQAGSTQASKAAEPLRAEPPQEAGEQPSEERDDLDAKRRLMKVRPHTRPGGG